MITMTKIPPMWIKAHGPGLTPSVLPAATTPIVVKQGTARKRQPEEEKEDGIWSKIW